MSMPISQRSLSCIIPTMLLIVLYFIGPTYGIESRKLDETGLLGSSDPSIKCGGCSPCGNPSCYLSPPPPPPPPSPPPPSPPPPPKKKPSSSYCPPPPYPTGTGQGFVYITAPPGDLYPVDPNYSDSTRIIAAAKNSFVGFGFLGLLMLLWL